MYKNFRNFVFSLAFGSFGLGYLCGLDNRQEWYFVVPFGLTIAVALYAGLSVWLPERRFHKLMQELRKLLDS